MIQLMEATSQTRRNHLSQCGKSGDDQICLGERQRRLTCQKVKSRNGLMKPKVPGKIAIIAKRNPKGMAMISQALAVNGGTDAMNMLLKEQFIAPGWQDPQ